ncbi:MAG TPA: hypothetical protein VKM35_00310 [Arenimonas sp.]|uniref:hypothetical protein n=1 Tax=Arenimonas sp. TaxID=1872635 RepID=UPI002B816210|nr:hypothetical protein [Arenimonas sp.]HMB55633.1 hypothetical protein [Arenimonas sp.]
MKRTLMLIAALFAFAATVSAQDRPYKEGPVTVVTAVKVKPGQDEKYLAYLDSTYKPLMEEEKKAGVILDYKVYSTTARTPNDPDLYLTVTYPNMASLDGLDERTEPLMKKVTGKTRAEAASASVDRGAMRDIMGSELIRELQLR